MTPAAPGLQRIFDSVDAPPRSASPPLLGNLRLRLWWCSGKDHHETASGIPEDLSPGPHGSRYRQALQPLYNDGRHLC